MSKRFRKVVRYLAANSPRFALRERFLHEKMIGLKVEVAPLNSYSMRGYEGRACPLPEYGICLYAPAPLEAADPNCDLSAENARYEPQEDIIGGGRPIRQGEPITETGQTIARDESGGTYYFPTRKMVDGLLANLEAELTADRPKVSKDEAKALIGMLQWATGYSLTDCPVWLRVKFRAVAGE